MGQWMHRRLDPRGAKARGNDNGKPSYRGDDKSFVNKGPIVPRIGNTVYRLSEPVTNEPACNAPEAALQSVTQAAGERPSAPR